MASVLDFDGPSGGSTVKLDSVPTIDDPPPANWRLEPDYVTPFRAWQAADNPTTSGMLLKAINPVIDQGVSVYGGKNANPMMRSRARKIALDAARKYDPTQASLKTHLMNHLQGLRRYGAQQVQVLNVPEQVALDQGHLVEAATELRDRLGRDPNDDELADHTGVSRKRIAYVRKYKPGFAESQIAAMGTNTGEDDAADPAVQRADPVLAQIRFLYDDFDPVDKVIVEYGYGLDGAPKLGISDIAGRLGITPGAVSQRAARIQRRLDQLGDMELF